LALCSILAIVASVFVPLGGYNISLKIDPKSVSVSGVSSGAFFAVQYEFAHSSQVMGVGVYAGGPYFCALDNLESAFLQCWLMPETISVDVLTAAAVAFEMANQIDPLSNLLKHKIYVYSGLLDEVLSQGTVKKVVEMFRVLNVSTANIKTKFTIPAEHAMPTINFGNACDWLGPPFINKCNYDGAGDALNFIYGSLKPKVTPIAKNLFSMPQQKFIPGGVKPDTYSLGDTLYFYVPTSCQTGKTLCKLHVFFHGCLTNAYLVGTSFLSHVGFNDWAESNNIVVVYPQTTDSIIDPINPQGCWDWWGYNGLDYALQSAPQIAFTHALINFFLS